MKLTNKDMVTQCLERIDLWQEHIRAVQAAQYRLGETRRGKDPVGQDLYFQLIEAELDEWRGLFMWCLTLDDAERDRIKAAAHERFLADHVQVAQWFTGSTCPSSWLSADEDTFRAMARNAFAPKEAP